MIKVEKENSKIKKNKNKVKKDTNKNNAKRDDNFSKIIRAYIKFYKENLKFKHIVITIIMIILFCIMFKYSITKFQNVDNNVLNKTVSTNSFFKTFTKDKVMISALVIFSGITPFVFFPVIGVLYSCNLASEIGRMYILNKSIMGCIFGSVGAIIQILGLSISISTGIVFCLKTTKRFIYNEKKGFGLKDVKKYIYKIRNNEEKIEEFEKKEQERAKRNEKYNVKINYLNLIISFVISVVILAFGTLIVYIVK